jgi:antitoxin component HigA of HigAB toxin-antitoxin module
MSVLPPITNDAEHAAALDELTALMMAEHDPPPDSYTGQRLQALAEIVEAYERIRWPI